MNNTFKGEKTVVAAPGYKNYKQKRGPNSSAPTKQRLLIALNIEHLLLLM
jgi:hypothetical protein